VDILVWEKGVLVQDIFQAWFAAKYEVEFIESDSEVIEFTKHDLTPKLLLTSVASNELDKTKLCTEPFRYFVERCPIILSIPNDSEELKDGCYSYGVDECVAQPLYRNHLLERIDHFIGGSQKDSNSGGENNTKVGPFGVTGALNEDEKKLISALESEKSLSGPAIFSLLWSGQFDEDKLHSFCCSLRIKLAGSGIRLLSGPESSYSLHSLTAP